MSAEDLACASLVPGVHADEPETTKRKLPVLSVQKRLLAQQSLTAVDRFSKLHEAPDAPLNAKYYRDLIPLARPQPGEQYAFEVDLDSCTGCKACVSACHNLNGLDRDELWRSVGLLHGGTASAPAQQTVTTSCHHCVDPACMKGCPTKAYEKDPLTGIVKHLDDQCFGCQYCTLMCPYDAPKYNKALGIVRKCDMCSSRLAHGEAPACVQACPNGAIAIRVVEQSEVVASSESQQFLPGAPTPEHTFPTTRYKTARVMPANMLPADFHVTRAEHSHPPLVIMLVLTQLSVGAFGLGWLLPAAVGSPLAQTAVACALALLALFASVFHLGRPLYAWRAVLGLRTSWLSREALAFGLFAQLAIGYGALGAAPLLPAVGWKPALFAWASPLHAAAAVVGVLGVLCSVMVYVATRREQWSPAQTGVKFFGSTALLGAATLFTVESFAQPRAALDIERASGTLLWIVVSAALVKLVFELIALQNVRSLGNSALKRMALVMLGELRDVTRVRFGLLAAGGLCLPLLFLNRAIDAAHAPIFAGLMFLSLLGGELSERYLFFRTAPGSRMPGGLK